MSDRKNADPADLGITLNRLSDAIERLNSLVENLAIELAELPAEELAADAEPTDAEEPPRRRPRILH